MFSYVGVWANSSGFMHVCSAMFIVVYNCKNTYEDNDDDE